MSDETKQQFHDFALAVELLLAALDYVEAAQRLIGTNKVLDVAAWAIRYCLYNLNETEETRN